MLYEFITIYRDTIIANTREKVKSRPAPPGPSPESEFGVPLLLTQLVKILHSEKSAQKVPDGIIGAAATLHGRELMRQGFSVSQVVHGYGDVCQAITEVAMRESIPITNDEFHTLNRCLDVAIAEAVTEFTRLDTQDTSAEQGERAKESAKQMLAVVDTATVAFDALKTGTVALNGNTSAVLGHSLMMLKRLLAVTVEDIPLASTKKREEAEAKALSGVTT